MSLTLLRSVSRFFINSVCLWLESFLKEITNMCNLNLHLKLYKNSCIGFYYNFHRFRQSSSLVLNKTFRRENGRSIFQTSANPTFI